jgi:hypothetical protein
MQYPMMTYSTTHPRPALGGLAVCAVREELRHSCHSRKGSL